MSVLVKVEAARGSRRRGSWSSKYVSVHAVARITRTTFVGKYATEKAQASFESNMGGAKFAD